MPFKTKKCIKRKKISSQTKASSSFPKRNSRKGVNQNILTISSAPNKKLSIKVMNSGFIARPAKTIYCHVKKLNTFPVVFQTPKGNLPNCSKPVRLLKKKNIANKYYDGVINRRLSHFNRFASNNTMPGNSNLFSRMPYQSNFQQMGLSRKEKTFLICSCQSRSARYVQLKKLAANAVNANKIFTIYGACSAVRNALTERGWIEKIPPAKMNLSKIRNGTLSNKVDEHREIERLLLSYLVEKYPANFIWRTKEEYRLATINMNKECSAIVNKLKINAQWTSKQGLCSSMKRNCWFYIENVADVRGPRSYNSYDAGETEGFVKDYQITACTSLLKWVISMVANDRPVFATTGKISMNVVFFALNRCKDYLSMKRNKDIDRSFHAPTKNQWNAFLKKYHRIISKEDVFSADHVNKIHVYLSYAKFLLKEIHKYRPQLSCEGCHNIWIIKPAHCSRGRGIKMASKLAPITNWLNKANAKYVVQKYIEEPLLIHDTKFDIRQYYLVTSTCPLVIWMYRDCYLKFSSQKYNLRNYHESIHLTNNAVQRKYRNCRDRHPDLPQNNMWDLGRYKDYLNSLGRTKVWDNIIYPGMKQSITGIMLSCQDSLSVCKNRFELYGCDFILDKEYKPWLIEINSSPDLNATTEVTATICPNVCADIIKVVIDHANDSKSPTGMFECIYRQPMTSPRYGGAADLYVRGFALHNEYFYKGNIEIKESNDDVDLEQEQNIKLILSKLNNLYDEDIMVELDNERDAYFKERCTRNTESEYELSAAASVITSQIEKLIQSITSEHSISSRSLPARELTISSPDETRKFESAKNKTDTKSLKKSGNRLASVEAKNVIQSFRFSKLGDEPSGDEPSGQESFDASKTSVEQAANALLSGRYPKYEQNNSYNNILQVANKFMSFINRKEEEYLIKLVPKQETKKRCH